MREQRSRGRISGFPRDSEVLANRHLFVLTKISTSHQENLTDASSDPAGVAPSTVLTFSSLLPLNPGCDTAGSHGTTHLRGVSSES